MRGCQYTIVVLKVVGDEYDTTFMVLAATLLLYKEIKVNQ
jgi:hypothetical protein